MLKGAVFTRDGGTDFAGPFPKDMSKQLEEKGKGCWMGLPSIVRLEGFGQKIRCNANLYLPRSIYRL
jgi:hypothetical protein